MKDLLIEKIKSKECVVGIIGMGYVGVPLALAFAYNNIKVIGFDIDEIKTQNINDGISYFKHIPSEKIKKVSEQKIFTATTDFSVISDVDAIILCLPTPLNKYREPDLSFIVNTMDSILPYLRKGQLLSLESTTYPGTTDEELATRISSMGLELGKDFFLVYSPEREDPGNPNFSTSTIPKVVGGTTKECLEVGVALYESIIDKVIPLTSTKAAELTKLLENIYRSVNIGLVNEMKMIADRMDIDIWEVIDAAATKPFGFTPFYPGPGLGGHCIPIDPFYLTWKAKEYGLNTRFIELSGEINTSMPEWVIHKIADALNEAEKSVKNSQVLVLGLSYKKNIDDVRESPSVELLELLRAKGARISYSDPYLPRFPKMREHHFDLNSVDITPEVLKQMDCVVISTDHDDFDYNMILEHSSLIVDTRGVYRGVTSDKVVRA
ncbi:nucleotide sugar dehydrogenase [Paenibacillus sp. oral taxon 786 str. D14]|uniref:nucleotide sugar dehydrogenase n=1 Tax=Paenibacillus sp. oral taxon 786 TaxID=652715 RepID=UPI0001AFD863|nr:nucleotide sugar dehydrogenase [Paenibacillus sp. oral taxon 786]EES72750.1 nucleotide sugar dehydrogenase [Paenibacillus sp. oral taxon 786 str. D14]